MTTINTAARESWINIIKESDTLTAADRQILGLLDSLIKLFCQLVTPVERHYSLNNHGTFRDELRIASPLIQRLTSDQLDKNQQMILTYRIRAIDIGILSVSDDGTPFKGMRADRKDKLASKIYHAGLPYEYSRSSPYIEIDSDKSRMYSFVMLRLRHDLTATGITKLYILVHEIRDLLLIIADYCEEYEQPEISCALRKPFKKCTTWPKIMSAIFNMPIITIVQVLDKLSSEKLHDLLHMLCLQHDIYTLNNTLSVIDFSVVDDQVKHVQFGDNDEYHREEFAARIAALRTVKPMWADHVQIDSAAELLTLLPYM